MSSNRPASYCRNSERVTRDTYQAIAERVASRYAATVDSAQINHECHFVTVCGACRRINQNIHAPGVNNVLEVTNAPLYSPSEETTQVIHESMTKS